MNSAVYFISTGRCGTQWYGKTLEEHYSDLAEVTHEPTKHYFPAKKYLRAYDKLDELLLQADVADYFQHIRKVLQDKIYIETGWPSNPALPMINRVLEGRMKLVHLVRHPVYAALSHATHNLYTRDDWPAKHAIDPFDDGILQKNLQGEWHTLSMYEKCLFFWTEINLYALELKERNPAIPYLLVKYEDIFVSPRPGALEEIITFAGLPYRDSIKNSLNVKVDNYMAKSVSQDWSQILKYPKTISLAQQFGYDIEDVDIQKINNRYFMNSTERIGKILKESGKKIERFLRRARKL